MRFRFGASLLPLLLSGCVVSPWQHFYTPNCPLKGRLPPRESAQIRMVEWEQLEAAFKEIDEKIAAEGFAPEDLNEQQREANRSILLKHVRLRLRASEVMVLGETAFVGEYRHDPLDGQLEAFARAQGADYAIATTKYLGTTQGTRTVRLPSTRHRTGAFDWQSSDLGGIYGGYHERTRGWNTVVVPAEFDHWGHRVIYLRRQ